MKTGTIMNLNREKLTRTQSKFVVYSIEIDGLFYVGSCGSLRQEKRLTEHKQDLKRNRHSKKLQEKYNSLQNPEVKFHRIRYFEAETLRERQREEEKEIRKLHKEGKQIANTNRYDNTGKGISYRSRS